jgi:hypothetical protein
MLCSYRIEWPPCYYWNNLIASDEVGRIAQQVRKEEGRKEEGKKENMINLLYLLHHPIMEIA